MNFWHYRIFALMLGIFGAIMLIGLIRRLLQ